MAIVLKKSVLKSEKGQRSLTASEQSGGSQRTQTQTQQPRDETQTTQRSGTTTQTQGGRTDTQTNRGAVRMDIEFELVFRGGSPVTPEGETEPNPAC